MQERSMPNAASFLGNCTMYQVVNICHQGCKSWTLVSGNLYIQ